MPNPGESGLDLSSMVGMFRELIIGIEGGSKCRVRSPLTLSIRKHEQKTKVHHHHRTAGIGENRSCQEAWRTPVDASHQPR